MRRIGSALAAGVATAGLFGAFALLNVAPPKPVEQPALDSFAIQAERPETDVPDAPAPMADPPPANMAEVRAEPVLPVPLVRIAVVTPPAPAALPPAASAVVPDVAGRADAGAPAVAAPAAPAAAAAPAVASRGGGPSGYAARVRAWLLAHKRYPRRARLHGEEGVVQLRFVLDRAGHLLDGTLVAGSRYAALDAEALAMLRRAVPYPLPPGEVRGDRIEIAAAVAFELPGR